MIRMAANVPRHMGGWKKDRPDHRDRFMSTSPMAVFPSSMELPRSIPIWDQYNIGSCTAFMGVRLTSWVALKNANQTVQYSPLFLYAATRMYEHIPLGADSGCEIRDVFKALTKYGVCLEEKWPYVNVDHNFTLTPSNEALQEALNHQALFYYRCGSLHTVRASINQGFPVGFGFSVPNNMMTETCARTGAVHYPANGEGYDGGHASVIWGYDDNVMVGNEKGAMVCANSWSSSWGMDGYFYLPYRFFNEGIATDLWTLRNIEL